jgi:hypothetical protein
MHSGVNEIVLWLMHFASLAVELGPRILSWDMFKSKVPGNL